MQRTVVVVLIAGLIFGAGVLTGRWAADRGETTPRSDLAAATTRPGDRRDPIRLGQSAEIGAWELLVEAYEPAGDGQVLAANQFNVESGEGWTYALVDVRLTRQAPHPGIIKGSLRPMLTTPADGQYPLTGACGVIDAPLETERLIAPRGALSGRWCWRLLEVDIDKVALQVADPSGRTVWFRLR